MKIIKSLSLIALTVIALAGSTATAQQSMTPYSKFGYGILSDNATASQRQMGGIGYAMSSGRQVNVMNPAAYAATDTLTFLFDFGVDFTYLSSKDTPAPGETTAPKSHQFGGGVDYITMQVPIGKRFGASLGLLPYSSVGYSFGSKIDNGTNSREGSGGINQIYLGFAGKVFKGFSLGFNFSYLFGHAINDVYVITPNSTSTTLFEQVTDVRDWKFEIGAQYSLNLDKDNRVTAGVVFSPGKTLLGNARVIAYDVDADQAPDTLQTGKLKGNASLPYTLGAGLSYEWKKRLMVEADFTYQPWSQAKSMKMTNFEQTKFADRWKLAVGGQYTPALRGNYFKRMTYRVGGHYSQDYMMVGNATSGFNNVREYGVSFGFGFPALGSKTVINLGLEYLHRQGSPQALLQENYVNVRLGINFNELWFFQNKLK